MRTVGASDLPGVLGVQQRRESVTSVFKSACLKLSSNTLGLSKCKV